MQFCGRRRYPDKEVKVFGGPYVSCNTQKNDAQKDRLREDVKQRQQHVAMLLKKDRMLREVSANTVTAVPSHGVPVTYGKKRSNSVDYNDSRNTLTSIGLLSAQAACSSMRRDSVGRDRSHSVQKEAPRPRSGSAAPSHRDCAVQVTGSTARERSASITKPPAAKPVEKSKPLQSALAVPKQDMHEERQAKILHFRTPPPPSPARVRSASAQPVQRQHFGGAGKVVDTVCYAAFDPSKETKEWPKTRYRRDMVGGGVQEAMGRSSVRSSSAVVTMRKPRPVIDEKAAGGCLRFNGSKKVFRSESPNPFAPLDIPPPPPPTTSGCIIDLGFNAPKAVRSKSRAYTPSGMNPIAHPNTHRKAGLTIKARAPLYNPILGL
eukprot:TRINITY_DN2669_c5_g1_i1.p1 TRINITY_DN2669_c5_g1~~TRINITY_DN2669_c5_g1_i1.p1  ORF type:complete len:377 (+),score=81.56 TRINITY_DN2669_c5_g1_i1:66-1196(+)